MQKISSYLYPNRIDIVADVAVFPVRWKIVYQNRVKIYQGVENVITLDIKNSDQKRIDITDMDLKMSITDVLGKEVTTVSAIPTATTGLATVNISAGSVVNLDPQFLNFTVYRLNDDDTKTVFYADTQFGAVGNMELLGSAVPVDYPTRSITRFTSLTDTDRTPYDKVWYSDAVEIYKPNNLILEASEELNLDLYFNKSKSVVTVQFTKDAVITSSTIWVDVLSFGVFPEDTFITKTLTYPTYTRDMTWMRIKLRQETYNGIGATVDITKEYNEGTGETEFKFVPNKMGRGYSEGDNYTIDADRLGGGGAWSLTVAKVNSLGEVLEWQVLASAPVSENGTVVYKDIPVNSPLTANAIDKVIVRL
jgi:hypothetical protein